MKGITVTQPTAETSRLHGLDLARFVALIGMVFVNFGMVMVTSGERSTNAAASSLGEEHASRSVALLQGRAAATFVVLAGIGLGLSARNRPFRATFKTTTKRAAFLLVLGLLNMLVFDADIIHYYAFFFLFGVCFVGAPTWIIVASMLSLTGAQVVMILTLEYDAGWDWATYHYDGFWTPVGFVRNLLFNGWHPVVPWLAFLLLGLLLARMPLDQTRMQYRLAALGTFVFSLTVSASSLLMSEVAKDDLEAAILFTTAPIPPMPLYMLAGGSAACAVIGFCLRIANLFAGARWMAWVNAAGRQTLTLYIAHILIGMGTLQALGMIGGQTPRASVVAAIVFCIGGTIFAAMWSRYFRRGPIESFMRFVTG